jgi:hypothetical protein
MKRNYLSHKVLWETSLSITEWMLSPIEECRQDGEKNHEGHHRDAVEHMIRKMFGPESEEDNWEMGSTLNLFWEEFYQFHTKTGPVGDRDHNWNSADIR